MVSVARGRRRRRNGSDNGVDHLSERGEQRGTLMHEEITKRVVMDVGEEARGDVPG